MSLIRYLTVLLALTTAVVANAQPVDFVLVKKSEGKLYLFSHGQQIAAFHIALGSNPIGHKQRQGDGRTPQGRYILDRRNEHSAYYKSLHVSYPNAGDRAHAKQSSISPGGDIMIHGQPNGWEKYEAATQLKNWTLGCIALTNEDMDAVWTSVPLGTPIQIDP